MPSSPIDRTSRPDRTPGRLLLPRRRALALMGAGLVCAAGGLLAGCGGGQEEPTYQDVGDGWVSPYDWTAVMTNTQGRKYYYPGGQLSSRVGVDVSDYNGAVDWEAVAADSVEFAFLRIGYRGYTEGGLFEDTQWAANIEGAQAAGLPVGAYFFSSAVDEDEAAEEARYALELLGGRELAHPLAFDQEQVSYSGGRANSLTAAQYTANAQAFCEVVQQAGYQPMVYGNQHHLDMLDLTGTLSAWPVWYAEYDVDEPTGQVDFTYWQYTTAGSVDGIEGSVDLDIQFLTE